MKNAMAKIMIDYINSVFAAQDDMTPVVIALCSDSGIDKNETWRTIPGNVKREVINMTIQHFQSEGYTITTQPGRYTYQFQRAISKAYDIEEARSIQKAAISKKNTIYIPSAIEMCLKVCNESIKTEAGFGKGSVSIDLIPPSQSFDKSLTYENRHEVYNKVWEILSEGGYMVRHQDVVGAKANVIWDNELIECYNKRDEEAKAAKEEARAKKKFLFWKRK